MPDEIITQGIPHKKLAPVLEKLKKRVFKHQVIKDLLKKYKIDAAELDLIPMCFAEIPVSARTDHGIIYINIDFAKDGHLEDDDHYIAHEVTHYCQQTTGDKPTPGSTQDNYLDNPIEQEGFRNQTKYISDTKGKEQAEEYIEQVLDHHEQDDAVDDEKREERRDKLLAIAKIFKNQNVIEKISMDKVDLDIYLRKYVNKGLFFRMSDSNEYWTPNIQTPYNTPIGLYFYPLDWRHFRDLINKALPWRSDAKYIWIFRLKEPQRLLLVSKYSKEMLIDDLKQLILQYQIDDIYSARVPSILPIKPVMDKDLELYAQTFIGKGKASTFASDLLYYLFVKCKLSKYAVSSALLSLGYSGMYDDIGSGTIHENEPIQAFIISSKFAEPIDIINNSKTVASTIPFKEPAKQRTRPDFAYHDIFSNDPRKVAQAIIDAWDLLSDRDLKRLEKENDLMIISAFLRKLPEDKLRSYMKRHWSYLHPYHFNILKERGFLSQHPGNKQQPPPDKDVIIKTPEYFKKDDSHTDKEPEMKLSDPDVRKRIAENPNTPIGILLQLSKDSNINVRMSVAENPKTPLEVLLQLSKDSDEYVRGSVADNLSTPPEILLQLSKDSDIVRSCVASNPSTPPEILLQLSKDSDIVVRGRVASNPNTPPEVLLYLSKDYDELVRYRVAENPKTPLEVLLQLSKDSDKNVLHSIAENTNTPPEILLQLSKDSDRYIRRAVSGNPKTPPEVLLQLSKDSDDFVRDCVASNPNTSPEALLQLSKDPDSGVRDRVANNLNTPPEVLSYLASDYNEGVRQSVAHNPNTMPEILLYLSKDYDEIIRGAVAQNPNTPPEILSHLPEGSKVYVRIFVAQNLNTPAKVLLQLSKDPDEDVRRSVAKNPNTSSKVLLQLSKDTNEYVGETAKEALKKLPSLKKKPKTYQTTYTEKAANKQMSLQKLTAELKKTLLFVRN